MRPRPARAILLVVFTAATSSASSPRQLWSRDLLFHGAGLLTAQIGLVLWVTGLAVSLSLAITYFGLIVALGMLLGCRWFARLERRRAGIVLGAPIGERYAALDEARWTARLHALIGDPTTWRDFIWTGLAGVIGMTLSSIALTLWGLVLGLVTLPLWFWALLDGAELGILNVDTLPLALGAMLAGLALVPIAGWIVRGLTVLEIACMRGLLTPGPQRAAVLPSASGTRPAVDEQDAPPPVPIAPPLALHASFCLLIAFVVLLIWGLTGLGYFWPVWVWFGLAITVALRVVAVRAWHARHDVAQAFRAKAELAGVIAVICWIVWALAGAGYVWPVWPMLGMGTALALRGLIVFRHRLPWIREQHLAERVDVLTRTRKGALDAQAAELRRIERDLHDGAQARLVALTMRLGRAEERVTDQPELAALLRGAREDAGLAIAELRDLARGIAPPILADRGLAAAIEALGRRSAIPVTVDADPDERPLPVVETAAYFVVAESLTNVAKHGGGASARVRVAREADDLVVEIADDGPGGADPDGGGLTGLRHRVEALDGTLTVTSPPGGGTTIRAELPCGP